MRKKTKRIEFMRYDGVAAGRKPVWAWRWLDPGDGSSGLSIRLGPLLMILGKHTVNG